LSDIARQNAQATNVAGVRTWNSLGRFVKRGEKGIFILAPMIGHKKTDEATESTADAKDATAHLYGFRAVYVFDVSQTEGKDLPTLTDVQGDVNGYKERLFDFVKSQGIELNYSERIAPAKGLSHGGKITLLTGMQPAEEFSTLAHEIAHELLHRGERRTLTTKEVRETEAEAVAYVVNASIGLQTGTASADYIQRGTEMPVLRQRLPLESSSNSGPRECCETSACSRNDSRTSGHQPSVTPSLLTGRTIPQMVRIEDSDSEIRRLA
jgi:hypothetical protein